MKNLTKNNVLSCFQRPVIKSIIPTSIQRYVIRRYYCELCDKIFNLKSKKKQLISKSHEYLYMSVVNRKFVKNHELVKIEEILQKHLNDYNTKFGLFHIICEWKLHFKNGHITKVKSIKHKKQISLL